MQRNHSRQPSSFGREVTLRLRKKDADYLATHMRQNPRCEQMAFGLGVHQRTAVGTVFLLNEIILPDRRDLMEQSAGGVCPAREFQGYVYFRAQQTRQDLIEFHTHPGSHTPSFSLMDQDHALQNAQCISDRLPDPVTLLMVVGNNVFDAFDAVVWDRTLRRFRTVERMEYLGRPSETLLIDEARRSPEFITDELYDRQMKIPGWNQAELARQRIGIIGLGGNGAQVFQTLIGMGAGRDGWLSLVDDDIVEPSNLPRIPYATAEHQGMMKVTVATQWAGRKAPSTPVVPFPCSVTEAAAQDRLAASTVLIGGVDNDGGRLILNELAVRYGIPLVDLGCDIQVEEDRVSAGGQVRVVLPGQNACLVCCHGFDPSAAANDLADDAEKALRVRQGYIQGASADATPSVANLNAVIAQIGIAQFLALVNGGQFADWDFAHLDQLNLATTVAHTTRRDDCPCCGRAGFLGRGYSVEETIESDDSTIGRLEAIQ